MLPLYAYFRKYYQETHFHYDADDIQLYSSVKPDETSELNTMYQGNFVVTWCYINKIELK